MSGLSRIIRHRSSTPVARLTVRSIDEPLSCSLVHGTETSCRLYVHLFRELRHRVQYVRAVYYFCDDEQLGRRKKGYWLKRGPPTDSIRIPILLLLARSIDPLSNPEADDVPH